MALLILTGRLASAAPFEDSRRRFRVELPEAWVIAPQFGDVNGMVFQKKVTGRRGTSLATLIIHSDAFGADSEREAADRAEEGLRSQPGFQRVEERPVMVGGQPALLRVLRTSLAKKPKLDKQIEGYFLQARGHVYMLHFESPAPDFTKLRPDIDAILASFVALAAAGGGSAEPIGGLALEAPPPKLAGRWINDDGLVLVLADDGSFALAEAAGRYELKNGTLTLIIPDQGRESFSFEHDAGAGTLTLSSPNLDAPMTYRRARAGAAQASAPGTAAGPLLGRWTTPTPGGPLVLQLEASGDYSMGGSRGRWSVSRDTLSLSAGGGAPIVYRWKVEDGRLLLEGGDLDTPVSFTRP